MGVPPWEREPGRGGNLEYMGKGVGKFKDLLSTPLGSHIYYIHNIGEQPPPSPFLTFYVMNIVIKYAIYVLQCCALYHCHLDKGFD